ncbi:MAG TPA: flagellar M-ring protein FliF C-terminal domain-containing protein, partial [Jatrophihabitans sp.]
NSTVSHSYTYATGIPPLSEANTTETYGAGQNGAGGVLGAASPSPSATPSGSAAGGYRKTTATRDNAVNDNTETRSAAPGKVRTLSVAVLLDKNAPPVDEAQVRQLVSSAVGLNLKRGDSLALATAAFDTSAATAAQKAADQAATAAAAAKRNAEMISLAKTVLVVLLVLVVIVATLIASRRRRREGPSDDLDTFLATLNNSPGSLPPAPRDIVPPQSREAADNVARQRDLAEMADSQPQEVARLLRTWLHEKEN